MLNRGIDTHYPPEPDQSHWSTGIAIAAAIVITLAAFVWAFVAIDPYLSDFVSGEEPTVTAPAATPLPQLTPEAAPTPRG